MKRPVFAFAFAAALCISAAALAAGQAVPAYVSGALADPARTDRDRASDEPRHAAEVVSFADVKPGQRVVDLIPGHGYWSVIFSKIVGPKGRVYLVWPNEYDEKKNLDAVRALVKQAQYPNLTLLEQPANAFSVPEPVDVVFTVQNYHDYPDKFMGPVDPMVLNRQVFKALKPGGLFVVIDHVAEAGSGMRDTDTLHRIDPATVKAQVTAAGFVFEGESGALHNGADDHKLGVFDARIRGRTDQFIYRFRKPRR